MTTIERKDAVNWSTLKEILRSPKHYRHRLNVEQAETEAMLLGSLTHCAVYEPVELMNRYAVKPRFHASWGDDAARKHGYEGGKQSLQTWERANHGKKVVPTALWHDAQAMARALHEDPIAGPLVIGGKAEQLIHWEDEQTGIQCRGRVDHTAAGQLSDLKTSHTVDEREFVRKAIRLGYHGQIAYYYDGLAANGFEHQEDPKWIVVESAPPYDVVVWRLPESTIAAGRALYRRALDLLDACREAAQWPGVSHGEVTELHLPAWAQPETEAKELTLDGESIF